MWRTVRAHPIAAIIAMCFVVATALGVVLVACEHHEDEHAFRVQGEIPSVGPSFSLAVYQSLGVQLRPGHAVSLASNGAVFDAIVEEIRHAKSSIHVLLFIWQKSTPSDRILEAIAARSKGVACRVLVDDVGSEHFDEEVRPTLEAAGCEVRLFRPLPGAGDKLARNHRKIVVIDGRVAFTGGFGVRDEWLGDGVTAEGWRDANVRFTGPAVAEAQQAIAENWQEAGGTLFPPEAFPPPDSTTGSASAAFVTSTVSPVLTRAERLVQLFIQAAKKRLWIANAYFVPPDSILELMKSKAGSGVDVRLLVPGKKSDSKVSMGSQHMEYGSLVKSGIRVFEYQPSMMHSKTMLVDDELTMVSSINLEPLSLTKSEEDALVVQDPAFAAEMARTFESDCTHARPVSD